MDTRNLFRQLAQLIIFIFTLNLLATKFHWYSLIWWFDIFMHFMGGAWLGLVFVWFSSKKGYPLIFNSALIFKVAVWVLFVGVAWEVFEFYFINYVAGIGFDRLDTVSDLLLDLSGGLCAILYLHEKR